MEGSTIKWYCIDQIDKEKRDLNKTEQTILK